MLTLLKWINEQIDKNLTTDEIVKKSGYSKRQLHNIFIKNVHCGVSEYLRKKKLSHASTLLKITNMSIIDIADEINFSSAQSFSRAFRRYYNLAPFEYRRGDTWGDSDKVKDPVSSTNPYMINIVFLKEFKISGIIKKIMIDTRKRELRWNLTFNKFKSDISPVLHQSKKCIAAIYFKPSNKKNRVMECSWIINNKKRHNNKVSEVIISGGKYLKVSMIGLHDEMTDLGASIYKNIMFHSEFLRREGPDLVSIKEIDTINVEYTYFIPLKG